MDTLGLNDAEKGPVDPKPVTTRRDVFVHLIGFCIRVLYVCLLLFVLYIRFRVGYGYNIHRRTGCPDLKECGGTALRSRHAPGSYAKLHIYVRVSIYHRLCVLSLRAFGGGWAFLYTGCCGCRVSL